MPKPKAAAGAGVSTSETNEMQAAKNKVERAQALRLGDRLSSIANRFWYEAPAGAMVALCRVSRVKKSASAIWRAAA
jgi:hypothetical protein